MTCPRSQKRPLAQLGSFLTLFSLSYVLSSAAINIKTQIFSIYIYGSFLQFGFDAKTLEASFSFSFAIFLHEYILFFISLSLSQQKLPVF